MVISPTLIKASHYFVRLAGELIPLFLAATFLVGLIQEYITPEMIQNLLKGKKRGLGNLIASALGVLTPFCSCSTIPLLVGMLSAGVPFGIAMSFLIASPLANEIVFILLWGLFSWKVAVIYYLGVFLLAALTGIVFEMFGLQKYVKSVRVVGGKEHGITYPRDPSKSWWQNNQIHFVNAAEYAWTFFKGLALYLFAGIVVGSFIYGYVPEALILKIAGPQNPLAVLVAALIGAPMYVSAEAMIPIAYSLVSKSMSIGAVMALVMGGAGISIPSFIIIAKIFRSKLLWAYAASIVLIATFVGYAFNFLSFAGLI